MAAIETELASQAYAGGKRVRIQPLPDLPADEAAAVQRLKVTLYSSRPPVWRRLDIPTAMLGQVHEAPRSAPAPGAADAGPELLPARRMPDDIAYHHKQLQLTAVPVQAASETRR